VLGHLLQAVDIFLDVLWGTVVVVQNGKDAVDQIVVCDAKAVVDGEGKMDEVVQQEVQRRLDQLAQRLAPVLLARCSSGKIGLQQSFAFLDR
jgi:hypothetical protein